MRSKMWRCCERKKSSGRRRLDGRVQGVIVEQDGAQNAALGFEIVRERAFDADVGGHS